MSYYGLLINIIIVCYMVGVWISMMLGLALLVTGRNLPSIHGFFRLSGWIAVATFFCLIVIGAKS